MPAKMIGGVAAGLAEYLDIDATIVRLLFVLATFFHGSGLLIYIVLWIAMPAGPYGSPASGQPSGGSPGHSTPPGTPSGTGTSPSSGTSFSAGTSYTADPSSQYSQQPAGSPSSGNRSSAVIGWILVGLGVFFLMDEFLEPWFRDFFYWFNFRRIWPVVFIIVGVLIISSATKKEAKRQSADPMDPGDSGSPGDPDLPAKTGVSPEPPAPAAPGDNDKTKL